MPLYIFENPNTGKTKQVFLSIKEDKVYSEKGVAWRRVFLAANLSVDTKIDANSQRDFVEKTKNKNYNLGDMWDKSKELSQKREKDRGIDPVKEKTLAEYSKKRRGMKHTNKIVV